jgi:hypothetical protein
MLFDQIRFRGQSYENSLKTANIGLIFYSQEAFCSIMCKKIQEMLANPTTITNFAPKTPHCTTLTYV